MMNIVTRKNSHPVDHIYQFCEHRFNWKRRVPNKVRQRQTHKTYSVMCLRPTLSNQLELNSF